MVILELIHALKPRLSGLGPGRRGAFIRSKPIEALSRRWARSLPVSRSIW